MKQLNSLQINQPFIALFGSGHSVHELSQEDLAVIKSNAFVITINYAPVYLKGHLNMWSDHRVSEFMEQHFQKHPKEWLSLAREGRVGARLKPKVDYWFNLRKEGLRGNYTIVWALQLLKKYFPEKTILLFGVDMYSNQPGEDKWYDRFTDFDKKKRGIKYSIDAKLDQCAKQIAQFCQPDKVVNCNLKSRLAHFPKKDWRTVIGLKVLHLCTTPLAGAPVHLSNIINKYTPYESRTLLKNHFTHTNIKNLRWNYDVASPTPSQLQEAVSWADVIHFHRRTYPANIKEKPALLQFHSPPNGYLPQKSFARFNGRKLVIAQYHPRFYTDALIVPNMIDIWDPQFMPEEKPKDMIRIFYSWATEIKGGWSDKGSAETRKILEKIKARYGQKVDIKIFNNQPYHECMAEKRKAHICIDECVTGSYHLQSLEGCSVGALTLNNIDEKTASYIERVTGKPTHPFCKTSLDNLWNTLCYYIGHPEELAQKGHSARMWMEDNWDPKQLVYQYIQAYFNVLQYNTVYQTEKASLNGQTPPPQKEHQSSSQSAAPLSLNGKDKPQGRPFQELHQKYKGEDIYIFGTGPSLFKIEPDDYKDKICFGINFSFEVMPHMDHIFAHVIETYDAIKEVVDHQKLVLPETLVRQWYREAGKNKQPSRIPTQNAQAIIYPLQDPHERNLNKKHVQLQPDSRIFTWSTTTHSAIHLAAYAGAKNIYLIGVDYELFPDGRVHFDSMHSPKYGTQNWNANRKHQEGDRWLARELAPAGISIVNLKQQLVEGKYSLALKTALK